MRSNDLSEKTEGTLYFSRGIDLQIILYILNFLTIVFNENSNYY